MKEVGFSDRIVFMENWTKHIRIGSVILLVFWLCFFLFQQIDLTTADLGRFVQNGQQIFKGNW